MDLGISGSACETPGSWTVSSENPQALGGVLKASLEAQARQRACDSPSERSWQIPCMKCLNLTSDLGLGQNLREGKGQLFLSFL